MSEFEKQIREVAIDAAIVSGGSVSEMERAIRAVLYAYSPLVTRRPRRKPKKRSSRRLAVQAKRAQLGLTVDGKIRG